MTKENALKSVLCVVTWKWQAETSSREEKILLFHEIKYYRAHATAVATTTHLKASILTTNQLDALISQIYFWSKILHVSYSSTAHRQEFFTVHAAMVYVIQVCWQFASRIRTELFRSSVLILLASCQRTCMTYTIAACTVKNSWWWAVELSETCRVLFRK